MRPFREEIGEWTKGAMTEMSPDKIPLNASSRARNTMWVRGGLPAKRFGLSILTPTAPVGKPAIVGLGQYLTMSWAVFADGAWMKKQGDGTFASIDVGTPAPFTVDDVPTTAIANSLLFAVNGTDAKKTDGTTVTKFGIDAPAAPTVTDTGVGGNPSGAYSIALTAYNSNSGHESSRGVVAAVSVVGKKIKVQWTFPTDAQVTHIRVHIFKTGLTDRYFRLTSTNVTPDAGAYDAAAGGYPAVTSFVTLDVTDANITALINQTPGDHENDPPPTGTNYIFYHDSRMFATDGERLYYSKIDDPESFSIDRSEPVNPDDGQNILAFQSIAEHHLVIWKNRSLYLLTGPNDPNTWEIAILDPKVGLRTKSAVTAAEGELWWEAEAGYFRMAYGEKPQRMDSLLIGDKVEGAEFAQSANAFAAFDALRERVLFASAHTSETRNSTLLPYNNKVKVWEDEWDPMDISALGTWIDPDTEEPFVVVGGYYGRAFRLWSASYLDGTRKFNDALVARTLNGTVTDAGDTSLTDDAAAFDTEYDGLTGINVFAVDPNGFAYRNVIVSNTATVLTLLNVWSAVPTPGWTYSIGTPNWEFDTRYMAPSSYQEEGSLFSTRTFKHLLVAGIADAAEAMLDAYAILDFDTSLFARHVTFAIGGAGAAWDQASWDSGTWSDTRVTYPKRSLGLRGKVCGFRFTNRAPDVGCMLLGISLLGTEHSVKS